MSYLQQVTQGAAGGVVELDLLRVAEPPFAASESAVASATTAPHTTPWFEAVRVESAPASSSLKTGDVLVGSARGQSAVLRGLQEVHLAVTPVIDGGTGVPRIGIGMGVAAISIRPGIVGALRWGGSTTVAMITQLATALTEMVSGQRAPEISGPVGIAKISRQQAELGLMAFLLFLSVLSVNLGLINLLPIPALDGGRLLFVGLEALRGRRINPAREQLVHLIGFALVIGLMVFITVAEVLPALGWELR
jgi:RIP metalloprotease RseP